jgi:shikimate dehydrogenase
MSEKFQFGLIGRDIAYSRSPDIFRAINKHTGLEADFRLIDIPPERLAETLLGLKADVHGGVSVTIPYKQAVIPHIDEVDPIARQLKAVNSIKCAGTRLVGYNTDWEGFVRPLLDFQAGVADKPAVILGTGGVARAAVYGLCREIGIPSVRVYGREATKAQELIEDMTEFFADTQLSGHPLSELEKEPLTETGVVVNATPLGGFHHTNQSPFPDSFEWSSLALYYDLNYNDDNPLISTAREHGVASLDGTQMLVAQAIRSHELWTGRSAPFDAVYASVFDA